jgi:uncharacterized protein
MSLISILFSFTFDAVMSLVIALPLLIAGKVRILTLLGSKSLNLKNIKEVLDAKAKLYLLCGIGLFLILMLFPGNFTLRGKLDAATWILLIYPVIAFLYWLLKPGFRKVFATKAKSLITGFLILALAGSFLVFWGIFIEAERIVVRNEVITVPDEDEKILADLELVLVSDIHVGPLKQESFVEKLVSHLNEVAEGKKNSKKDLKLVMPGDFIASEFEEAALLYPLAGLSSEFESYAVLGNHDFNLTAQKSQAKIKTDVRFKNRSDKEERKLIGKEVARVLTDTGIKVLRNEGEVIQNGKPRVIIVGIDDVWSDSVDLEKALNGVEKSDYVVLLCHNPEVVADITADKDFVEKVDLVLAGHTHGGEIRLPAIPFLLEKGLPLFPLPTKIGQKYDKGYFEYKGKYGTVPLYITSGVGETGTRLRLFNPPEIVVLSFK